MIQGKKRTTEVRGHTSGSHFDLGNGFLDITKAEQQKKTDWTSSKFKTVVLQRILIKKEKRQPMRWVKISAKHICGKKTLSRIFTQLLQLNNKKINNSFKNFPSSLRIFLSETGMFVGCFFYCMSVIGKNTVTTQ